MTEEQKARLKELKNKGELTEEEKAEVAELNKLNSGKTYTQEEVNGLITKKSREAEEKLLKKLGVENFETAKEGFAKLQEFMDKDKTELEKAQAKIEELTSQLSDANGKLGESAVQVALLGANVPADKLSRYTKLYNTTEGETQEDRIKALMEEFPVAPATPEIPDFGGKTNGGDGAQTMESLQAQMDKIAGLS